MGCVTCKQIVGAFNLRSAGTEKTVRDRDSRAARHLIENCLSWEDIIISSRVYMRGCGHFFRNASYKDFLMQSSITRGDKRLELMRLVRS